MSFWNTFFKVWQVRSSIKIQESIEEAYNNAKAEREFKSNLPEIIKELDKKNSNWNDKMKQYRKKL
jgi:hypothetical protein